MKIIFKHSFYPRTLYACYLISLKSTFFKPPFWYPWQRVLCLILAFLPCQMKFFCILYIRSIVLLWNLVINKRCITLEIARDLNTVILPSKVNCLMRHNFNPIQDGLFRAAHGWGGGQKGLPLPKICHTYPTTMKRGTVIPYAKKIEKIYESRDTPLEFCWHRHFFTGNQQILVYQEI